MKVRKAAEADIPAIIELLRASLGESLLPKSEAYWRWKHVLNPFGASPVLVCLEHNELIGIRAFMRWEWMLNGKIHRALRAVDTATHPNHQGKGIFKKLTLALVNECIGEGDDFVFNTPNSQSKPGYLKMGWREAGRLPVTIGVERPFSILRKAMRGSTEDLVQFDNSELKFYLQHAGLQDLLVREINQSDKMTSNVSVPYLTWRYLSVPVSTYVGVGDHDSNGIKGLIIGRLKEGRYGRELRITDVFVRSRADIKALTKKFKESKRRWRVDYTTVTGLNTVKGINQFQAFPIRTKLGPAVTVRPLKMSDLNALESFRDWSPSLGDLELF